MISPIELALTPALGPAKHTNKEYEIRFCCPACIRRGKTRDKDYHLYLSTIVNKFHCYRCKFSGSVEFLLKYLRLDPSGLGSVSLARFDDTLHALVYGELPEEDAPAKVVEEMALPGDYTPCIPGTAAWNYLIKRWFTPETIKERGVGFGYDKLRGMVVFPEWDHEGNLLYWTSKPYQDRKRKPLNAGTSKQGYVYWLEQLTTPYVIITEAVFDSIAFKEGAVALLGSKATKEQMQSLISRDFRQYYVCLDGDALEPGLRLAEDLYRVGKAVWMVLLPYGEDPSSLGPDRMRSYLKDAKRYTPDTLYAIYLEKNSLDCLS